MIALGLVLHHHLTANHLQSRLTHFFRKILRKIANSSLLAFIKIFLRKELPLASKAIHV